MNTVDGSSDAGLESKLRVLHRPGGANEDFKFQIQKSVLHLAGHVGSLDATYHEKLGEYSPGCSPRVQGSWTAIQL